MASVNKVILVGNLGRDPEVKYMPAGDAVANIAIATSSKYKNKSGELIEETEWHRVSFFGRQAEVVGEYLRKGSSVYIEGRLKTRKYTDKDGVEKFATDIVANEMQMLGSKGEGGQRAAPPPSAPKAAKPPTGAGSGFDDMDDDVPFITSAFACDMTTSKARRMARYDY